MPGSSNFQIFNPGAANQENDSQYTSDGQRIGGYSTGALVPSKLLNKILYQASVGMYGLMQMMANKGFVVSDSNSGTLASVMANILTTADQKSPLLTVSWSPTLVFDCSRANGFSVTLAGNVTSLTVSNASAGQLVTMSFIQNATGNFTVAWPSNVRNAGLTSGVSKTNIQAFLVGSDLNLRALGPMTVSS